jgi:putative transposase
MREYIHKSHNVTVLLYHLVFPAKYRRAVFDESVDAVLREVCLDIEKRYETKFVEIGVDRDHVHFLVQSVPTYSVTKLVTMLKSLTAREVINNPAASRRSISSQKSVRTRLTLLVAGNGPLRDSSDVRR